MTNETSFGAALKKAGLDLTANELRVTAMNLLKDNNNEVEKVWAAFVKKVTAKPELLGALALDYLRGIAVDLDLGQGRTDPQVGRAKIAAAGQATNDAHGLGARGGIPKGLAIPDEPAAPARPLPGPLSPEKRKANIEAKMAGLIFDKRKISGRSIGDLRWGELEAIQLEKVSVVSSTVLSALQETADALLVAKIHGYAVVDDPDKRIRHVVPAAVLERMDKEAREQAPTTLNITMAATQLALTKQIDARK